MGQRLDMRRRLFALAARQSGYFSARQALTVGYSYSAQNYHVDRGNWTKVDRAIFRLPDWPPDEHDSLVRWSLWARDKAVVSHETALDVHRLGLVNPAVVHLTVPPNFRPTAPGVRLHHGDLPAEDVLDRQGFQVTTPLRTILDLAADHLDVDQFATAIDDALQAGLVTRRLILARVDAFGAHGALRIERALQAIGARQ